MEIKGRERIEEIGVETSEFLGKTRMDTFQKGADEGEFFGVWSLDKQRARTHSSARCQLLVVQDTGRCSQGQPTQQDRAFRRLGPRLNKKN